MTTGKKVAVAKKILKDGKVSSKRAVKAIANVAKKRTKFI